MTYIAVAGVAATPNQWISSLPNISLPVQSFVAMPFNAPSVAATNWGSGPTLVCPTLGYYTCVFMIYTPSVSTNRQVQIRLLRNGSQVWNPGTIEVGDFGNNGMWGATVNDVFSVGETLALQGMSWQTAPISVSGGWHVITYVPTPNYRK